VHLGEKQTIKHTIQERKDWMHSREPSYVCSSQASSWQRRKAIGKKRERERERVSERQHIEEARIKRCEDKDQGYFK
jgi:hypothetical protein